MFHLRAFEFCRTIEPLGCAGVANGSETAERRVLELGRRVTRMCS